MKALFNLRRKETSFFKNEMFGEETREQIKEKFDIMKNYESSDKASRLAKYEIIKANVVIDSQVDKTKTLFKKAAKVEDEINESLFKNALQKNKKGFGRMRSNLD